MTDDGDDRQPIWLGFALIGGLIFWAVVIGVALAHLV